MKSLSSRQFMLLIIVILVVLNTFALVSIWIQKSYTGRMPASDPTTEPGNISQFVKDELGLTELQVSQFENLRANLKKKTMPVLRDIHQLREQKVNEIFQTNPDQEILDRLSEEIGQKQAEMERLTNEHFLELISLCKMEQREKLRFFLQDIMGVNSRRDRRPPGRPGDPPPHRGPAVHPED